jgi:hypothetical protein
MKPENWITLCGTAATAVLTVIGLYFGPKRAVRLSLEQFRTQKWWERKASAYDDLIRATSRLLAYHGECFDMITMGWNPSEEKQKESDGARKQAMAVLETYSALGGFSISEDAGKVVKRILLSEGLQQDDDPHGYHDRTSGVLVTELAALKQYAVGDLNFQ